MLERKLATMLYKRQYLHAGHTTTHQMRILKKMYGAKDYYWCWHAHYYLIMDRSFMKFMQNMWEINTTKKHLLDKTITTKPPNTHQICIHLHELWFWKLNLALCYFSSGNGTNTKDQHLRVYSKIPFLRLYKYFLM